MGRLLTFLLFLFISIRINAEIVVPNNPQVQVEVYRSNSDILIAESLNNKVSPQIVGNTVIIKTKSVGEDIIRIILGNTEEVNIEIRVEKGSIGFNNASSGDVSGQYRYTHQINGRGEVRRDQFGIFNLNVEPFKGGNLRSNVVFKKPENKGWEKTLGDVFYQSKLIDLFYGQREYFQENIPGMVLDSGEVFGGRYKRKNGDRFSFSKASLSGGLTSHRLFSFLRPNNKTSLSLGLVHNDIKTYAGYWTNFIFPYMTLTNGTTFDEDRFFTTTGINIFNNDLSSLFRNFKINHSLSSNGTISESEIRATGRKTHNLDYDATIGGRINRFTVGETKDLVTKLNQKRASYSFLINSKKINSAQKTIGVNFSDTSRENFYDRSIGANYTYTSPLSSIYDININYLDGEINQSLGVSGNINYWKGADRLVLSGEVRDEKTSNVSDQYRLDFNAIKTVNLKTFNLNAGIRPRSRFIGTGITSGPIRVNYRTAKTVSTSERSHQIDINLLLNSSSPKYFLDTLLDRFNSTKVVTFIDSNFNNRFDEDESLVNGIVVTLVQGGEKTKENKERTTGGWASFSGIKRSTYTSIYFEEVPDNLLIKNLDLSFPTNPSIFEMPLYNSRDFILRVYAPENLKHDTVLNCKRSKIKKTVEISTGENKIKIPEDDNCQIDIPEHPEFVTFQTRLDIGNLSEVDVNFTKKNLDVVGEVVLKGGKGVKFIEYFSFTEKRWKKVEVDEFGYFSSEKSTQKVRIKGYSCSGNISIAFRGNQKFICKKAN